MHSNLLRAWRTLYTHRTFTGYPKKWQHARCYNPYKWSIQTCWLITGQKKLYTHRTFTGYLLYPCRQPVRIWPLLPIHTVRHIRHKHSRRPAAGRHLRRWNAAIFRTQCSKDAVRFSAFDSSWARRTQHVFLSTLQQHRSTAARRTSACPQHVAVSALAGQCLGSTPRHSVTNNNRPTTRKRTRSHRHADPLHDTVALCYDNFELRVSGWRWPAIALDADNEASLLHAV